MTAARQPRLAYLDNGPRPDRSSGLEGRFQRAGMIVDRYWAFDGVFPERPEDYDGVLLSGSPLSAYDDLSFIHREHEFIRELAVAGIPTLGLCFGSQILASALCGRDQVFRRATCEVGHADLAMTPAAADDALTGDAGNTVRMFVWHNDEVRAGHADMTVLARTADCPNHIWRYRNLPIWGIQGHPEVTRDNAANWMGKSREVLARDGADPDALVQSTRDSKGGMTMLANFTKVCSQRANNNKTEENNNHGSIS